MISEEDGKGSIDPSKQSMLIHVMFQAYITCGVQQSVRCLSGDTPTDGRQSRTNLFDPSLEFKMNRFQQRPVCLHLL